MGDDPYAEIERLRKQVREERRLRQAADSALAQIRRHPNSKLDNVADYYYRLGKRWSERGVT